MRIIGFNFTKINAEIISDSKPAELKINTGIQIKEISKPKTLLTNKDEVLSIKFTYNIDYNPKFAKIEFFGEVILTTDNKQIQNILNQWKDKKLPEEFKIALFNVIFRKSNIKALDLEDQLNLPLHIPFPNLSKKQ
jgi:hypothetical protein